MARELLSREVNFDQGSVDGTGTLLIPTYILPTDNFGWQILRVDWSLNSTTVEFWPVLGGCSFGFGFYRQLLNKTLKTIFFHQFALRDTGLVPCSFEWTAPPNLIINTDNLYMDFSSSSTLQLNDVGAIIWYKKVPLTEAQKLVLHIAG